MARKGKSKRRNGQGSVYAEGEKWRACIIIGKRRIRRTLDTEDEAWEMLSRLLAERDGGGFTVKGGTTVGQFLWDWLEDVRTMNRVRPNSLANMRPRLQHVAKHVGTVHLDQLTPQMIRRAYGDLLDTLSPRTVATIHGHFKQALRAAVTEGAIAKNPCDLVQPPRWETREMVTLSPEQVGELLDALASHRLYPLFVVLATTGIRFGEAAALRWSDVEGNQIHVRRTVSRVGKLVTFGPPKTRAGIRTVQIRATTLDILKAHRTRQVRERLESETWEYPELVFPTEHGQVLRNSTVGRVFKAALNQAGLPNVRMHDLRHTYATTMLARGVQVHTLQRLMGHADPGMTQGLYGHVVVSKLDEAADIMEAAIFGPKQRG